MMQHFILNEKPISYPESKRLAQFYKQKINKFDNQIAEENNKSTKTRLLKECELERNLYHEECGRLNTVIKQLRAEIDNLR